MNGDSPRPASIVSRRAALAGFGAGGAGVALAVTARHSSAQNATPAATAGHPLVGAWLLDTDTAEPSNPPTLATFSSDGVYTQIEPDTFPGVGAWRATGAQSAEMNFHQLIPVEQGGGISTIRAAIEVGADGQSVTAMYTLELVDADGVATGQYGPGQVSGTRIAVEPMGEPLGTFDDFYGQFEEGGAPPEASPTA